MLVNTLGQSGVFLGHHHCLLSAISTGRVVVPVVAPSSTGFKLAQLG
jgi:hypothetical protein